MENQHDKARKLGSQHCIPEGLEKRAQVVDTTQLWHFLKFEKSPDNFASYYIFTHNVHNNALDVADKFQFFDDLVGVLELSFRNSVQKGNNLLLIR